MSHLYSVMIVVKHCIDSGKYKVEKFVEMHRLVTPSKLHLIRSNCEVSDKAKTTLFDCSRASIGTSRHIRCFMLVRGVLRMWDAQEGTCRITDVTLQRVSRWRC